MVWLNTYEGRPHRNRKMVMNWKNMVTKGMLGMMKERQILKVILSILCYIITIHWEKWCRGRARFRRERETIDIV
jgi:hypothetical protein